MTRRAVNLCSPTEGPNLFLTHQVLPKEEESGVVVAFLHTKNTLTDSETKTL